MEHFEHVFILFKLISHLPIHEISVTIYPLSFGMLICRPYRLPASCLGLWNQHNNRSKPVVIVGHRMGLPQSKKKGHTHTGHKIYAPLAKKFRLYFMGLLFSGFRPVFLGSFLCLCVRLSAQGDKVI